MPQDSKQLASSAGRAKEEEREDIDEAQHTPVHLIAGIATHGQTPGPVHAAIDHGTLDFTIVVTQITNLFWQPLT